MRLLPFAGFLMNASLFAAQTIYDFSLKTIDGQDMPLAAYQGKVVLLVNTASQ